MSTGADSRLSIDQSTPIDEVSAVVRAWVEAHVPTAWQRAAAAGGPSAIRDVRSFDDYESWYPVFADSGLVVPAWEVEYGGLGLSRAQAKAAEAELSPFRLGRLNPLGLNQAAHALFEFGTEEQRLRFLPKIVRNEEKWCQLFSEPGAGSDLASLACKAVRDGDEWVVSGQKIWTTWAHRSDFAVLIARTDPEAPKRKGITFFMLDLHQPGVEVRPIYDMRDEVDFNEVFMSEARVPDAYRVGERGDGWRVANASLSGERQMVAGSGSGGIGRIGGRGIDTVIELARSDRHAGDPIARQRVAKIYCEEKVREWTNARVRATLKSGRAPGPESSIGIVHQSVLNQQMQGLAVDLDGLASVAWEYEPLPARYGESLTPRLRGMFRSLANTIEGGTTEINKNILGERVLGLPREPDPWHGANWNDVPRS